MKKKLYIHGEYSGELGKPVFKDTLGRQLCVGDIVYTIGAHTNDINIVADNYIYGWASSTYEGNLNEVSAYKIINYTEIENLENKVKKRLPKIEIKLSNVKEMTISEIEKELGYPIKIVKEN